MDLKGQDVLVLKPQRGGVLLNSVIGLVLAGVIAGFSLPAIDPWAIGIAVVVVLWGLHRGFSTRRIPVEWSARTVRIDGGPPLALDAVLETSISEESVDDSGLRTLMAHLGAERWVPIYVGSLEAAQAVESFVHAAKSKLQEPVKPAAPIASTPSELVSAIRRARGAGAKAENIRCYVRGRHATGGAGAVPAPYEAWLERLEQLDDGGPVKAPWSEFPKVHARARVANAIRHELAHGEVLMTPAAAEALAEQFLSLFDEEARFFMAKERLTDWSFDGGVAVRDATRTGLLWFESDDCGR